jgi:hypothetical protein
MKMIQFIATVDDPIGGGVGLILGCIKSVCKANFWHSLKHCFSWQNGVLAQLVERLNGIEEVTGSNPVGSTPPRLRWQLRVGP